MDTVKFAYSVIESARIFCRFYRQIDKQQFVTNVLPDTIAGDVISAMDAFCAVVSALENSDPGGFFERENDGPSGKEDI